MCQPGRPVAERGLPGLFAGFDGLPEGEVARGVLLVLVDVDAGAVFDAFEVLLGELAVLGKARDAEVPGAVLGLVGDVLRGELLDERDHLRNAVGGAGDVLGALDAEGVEVLEEGALEAWRCTRAMGTPAAAALRMILSSTSVMFMTWLTAMPCWRTTRRRTSTWRKVRKLPMWP